MSSEKSSFDDDVFEDDDELGSDLDDAEELDFTEDSSTTKRRMIEDLLEERRLLKQISEDYDFEFDEDD